MARSSGWLETPQSVGKSCAEADSRVCTKFSVEGETLCPPTDGLKTCARLLYLTVMIQRDFPPLIPLSSKLSEHLYNLCLFEPWYTMARCQNRKCLAIELDTIKKESRRQHYKIEIATRKLHRLQDREQEVRQQQAALKRELAASLEATHLGCREAPFEISDSEDEKIELKREKDEIQEEANGLDSSLEVQVSGFFELIEALD